MKKIVSSIVFLLLFTSGFAQTVSISEFWNLQFGMTKEEVLNTLKSRGIAPIKTANDNLLFSDVQLGSETFDRCVLNFKSNRLSVGYFRENLKDWHEAIDKVKEYKTNFDQQYGNHKKDKSSFVWGNENSTTLAFNAYKDSKTKKFNMTLTYADVPVDKQSMQEYEKFSQTVFVEGFGGVKFGEKKDIVAQKLSDEGINVKTQRNDLYLDEISLGGHSFGYSIFCFYKDSLYTGVFNKNFDKERDVTKEYNELAKIFDRKYGDHKEAKPNGLSWGDEAANNILLTITHSDNGQYLLSLMYKDNMLASRQGSEFSSKTNPNQQTSVQVPTTTAVITPKTAPYIATVNKPSVVPVTSVDEPAVTTVKELPFAPVNQFWGVKLGMSYDDVLASLESKGLNPKQSDAKGIYFTNVELGGYDFDATLLAFYKDNLYSASFNKKYNSKEDALDQLTALTEILDNKYGNHTETSENAVIWGDTETNSIVLKIKLDKNGKYLLILLYRDKKTYLKQILNK